MKIVITYCLVLCFFVLQISAQDSLVFDGQASAYVNYSPDNKLNMLAGGRYLPQLDYTVNLINSTKIDFEGAANIFGTVLFHPFDSSDTEGDIKPYRLWGRFTGKQFEIRLGLQKIDFGSAMLLRPLQWFDEVDPRDPLKFTTGVYGALGRYYFLNNVNIWAWVLYGNENPRGFEIIKNNTRFPEFGGRVQVPVPRGEFAATYHHRTADSRALQNISAFNEVPEDRIPTNVKFTFHIIK
ncbi:MAG: hypothetical protein JXJ22_07315 [Bacteroidales bacterium]|nr:hypothetical protein [Bacteroidales bacterium]